MTVDNLKGCEVKFRRVMSNKYGLVFDSPRDTADLRQLLYTNMQSIASNAKPNDTVPSLNTILLNTTRDAVLNSHKRAPPPAAQASSLLVGVGGGASLAMERDRDIYGAREVQYNTLLPEVKLPGPVEEVQRRFEAANQRYEPPPLPPASIPQLTQSVSPMDAGEFENCLADRMAERKQIPSLPPSTGPFVIQQPPDVLAIMRKSQEEADEFKRSPAWSDPGGGPLMSTRAETFIQPPRVTQVIPRYITINGADRDVVTEPYRYQFTLRTGGRQSISTLQSSYTNIAWLEVTRVIVPQEIVSALGTSATISGNYNTEFSFAYPYLLLQIDGIDDVCDGTNDPMRKAFSTLIFSTEYKAPNGRGYVSLHPGQMERKTYISPMASLPDLKISLCKPNGLLFNRSKDAYTVGGGTLPCLSISGNYITIRTDQYFDRNELWVGDSVTITGLVLQAKSQSSAAYVNALQSYLTQSAGLEIVDLPVPKNGFYNGICVKAPAMFNQTTGAVVVDANISSAISDVSYNVTSSGIIVNTSLQAVVMMTAGVVTGAGLPPASLN